MGRHDVRSAAREVHYDRGTNWRAQLGFIVISTDLVMEENIARLAPEGVGTSVTRLKTATECNLESLSEHIEGMAEAASILQPGVPDADAIFVSCGGTRTIDVLQEIEDAAANPRCAAIRP